MRPVDLFKHALLFISLAALGCAEPPTQFDDQEPPSFGKGNVDTDPRALVEWANAMDIGTPGFPNIVPTRIRGDGRLENGTSAAGAASRYQGEFCGVHAKIFQSGSGDLVFSPASTKETMECGGVVRTLGFDFGSGLIQVNTSTNARNLRDLAVGAHRVQNMPFGYITSSGCDSFRFRADSVNGVEISSQTVATRLPDMAPGVRQWRVESRSTHSARCMVSVKGRLEPTGAPVYLPFSVIVTEVPFPYPTQP
jgi:hypothetical protein